MDITVYIKADDLDLMVSFYKRTNNNEQFRVEDIPDIDIFEKKPTKGKFIEMHLHYDIYQGMKYALAKIKQLEKKEEGEGFEQFKATSDLLKKAENLKMQDEVVYAALKAMKDNSELTPSEAMNGGLIEWDIS